MAKQPDSGPRLDVHLGQVVRSDEDAARIAKEMGLIDSREFAEEGRELEVIQRIARENRAEEKSKTWSGYDEAIHRAAAQAERGEAFEAELADRIRELDERNGVNKK